MGLRSEAERHLREVILPFWQGLRDDENGGYIGLVTDDLVRHPEAVKGCILNSRILYFFSRASQVLGDKALLKEAEHAYDMLCRMIDAENGGVYWSVNADGTVADATKHTYNEAFSIYALAAYADACGRRGPLEQAMGIFRVIEHRMTDELGYLEALTADFKPQSNEKLSENGVMASKTMNTLLHVLEAYTELYRVGRDPAVRERLLFILKVWEDHMYNPALKRQEVFFDRTYRTLIDLHSFGHDIETSWLADRTLEVLDDPELTARLRPKFLSLAEETLRLAFTEQGFANEMERGVVDETRVWWVQAEALVGFLNAWQKTGETRYRDAALSQWRFIKKYTVDPRPGSEWFANTDREGHPDGHPLVEPWKCPYHNGRMVFEIMGRLKDEDL